MRTKRRDVLCILCLVVLAERLTVTQGGIYGWWALGVQQSCAAVSTTCSSCSTLSKSGLLTQNQTVLCQSHGDGSMVGAISKGTLQAIRDCQNKFSNWRWNCPTFLGENLFGKFIENDTKERAVLNAYMSAGAAHSIAKACKDSLITGCSCKIQTTTTFTEDVTYLHACGDDVLFAIDFLRNFTGNSNNTAPFLAAIDKHNNEVGYKAVENRTQYCRCTGLSGSCTLQTCYLRSPAIEEVGVTLRIKYDGAQAVQVGNSGSLVSINQPNRPLKDNVLIYESQSPNLCEAQPHLGVLGVEGRKCDPTSHGTDGCNIMCCGYGHSEYERQVPVENCEFKWCCRIECQLVSNQTVLEYKCNGPPTSANG